MKTFANILKNARKRAGLSQHELAGQIGVDHSYISKIERSVTDPPTRNKVLAMTRALGISNKVQRAYFLLAAGCANLEDLEEIELENLEENKADIPYPFYDNALTFPGTYKMEEIDLIERIRALLRDDRLPMDKQKDYLNLLRLFVELMESKIEEENEES